MWLDATEEARWTARSFTDWGIEMIKIELCRNYRRGRLEIQWFERDKGKETRWTEIRRADMRFVKAFMRWREVDEQSAVLTYFASIGEKKNPREALEKVLDAWPELQVEYEKE